MPCLEDVSLMSKLKLVFQEFDNGNTISDMLLLDQFLTWLQSELCDEGQCKLFIEATNFMSFASSCLNKSETEVQWSLVLQLVGRFASLQTSITEEFAKSVFKKACNDKKLWTQTAVRVAWLNGLASLSSNWKVLFYGDFFATVSTCLYDTSWFVRKAAVSLLLAAIKRLEHIIVESGQVDTEHDNSLNELKALRDIVTTIFTILFDDPKCDIGEMQLNVQLELIQHLDFSSVKFWCAVLAVTPQVLVSRFFCVLEHSVNFLSHDNEMVLLGVFQQFLANEDCKREILKLILPFVWSLLDKNKLLVAISLSAWTLKWFGSGTGLDDLENIISLPISAAINLEYKRSETTGLFSDHQELLSKSFSHLILNKSLHKASLKLSISCMLQMGNYSSQFIKSICEFLVSTYDESTRAHCLVSNTPIQLLCLNAFDLVLSNCEKTSGDGFPNLHRVQEILLLALSHSAEDYKVVAKVLDISNATMSVIYRQDNQAARLSDFMDSMSTILEKISCSSSWNVRDTVIEFFKRLLDMKTDVVYRWIIRCKWHESVWQAVDDTDNFVRASAFLTLNSLYECEPVWLDLTTHRVSSEVIKRRVAKALCEDPSEFVRRAAAILVSKLRHDDDNGYVLHAMRSALTDADREVQLSAVEFWKNVLVESVQSGGTLQCIDSLIDASSDCDRHVRIAALNAVIDIKRQLLSSRDKSAVSVDRDKQLVILCTTDWQQQLAYEKQYIEAVSVDSTNALLDDVLTNLSPSTALDDDVIVDCY